MAPSPTAGLLLGLLMTLAVNRVGAASSWVAAAAGSSSCLPVSVSIKAPARVAPADEFRIKVSILNQGSSWIQGASVGVQLPVGLTVLKSPSGLVAAGDSPWSLVLPALSLAPRKSQTLTIKVVVGKAFQGSSATLTASASLPSDPTCDPVAASRVITIKAADRAAQAAAYSVDPARVLVECGQPLPFLPPAFPIGACGDRTTADPRVWGPEAWRMLHIFAQNFPADPTQQAIEACTNFINALPWMLPSPLAGYTLGTFITANNAHAGTFDPACQANAAYNMPCTTPVQACVNQSSLVAFFLRAHHAVDALTNPCGRLWTLEEAARAYANETDFCATCIVWGTYPICKDQSESGCAQVTTTGPCGAVAPPAPSPAPPTVAPTQSPTSSQQRTVECGVVLEPSISNWAMGQCGTRTTADPRVFGPFTWRTLHRFAQHYPLAPSSQTQEACVNFINALPFLIPCPHCGYDFSQFIVDNIENQSTFSPDCKANATYAMPCTTPAQACATRELLIPFFLRAHHNVDSHNKPCKPLWSRQQAAEAFLVQPGFCATSIVNGRYELCRSVSGSGADATGCVTLPTSPPCGQL